jgi:Domain of unknown function (DUF4129)
LNTKESLLTKFISLIFFTVVWVVSFGHPTKSILADTTYLQNNEDSSVFEISETDKEKYFSGPADTTRIEVRKFSQSEIDRVKADPDLNYAQPPTVAETLWDRFLQWLVWLINSLFGNATTTDLGRFLMYTIAIILTIVVIMMLLKVNAFRVFYSGADQGKQGYQVFHENIHEMNFEKLIQEATEKNEYRLATRLVFLYALKILSDKHLIDFSAGKTNHDYVEELKKGEMKTGLNELSFYFDYAWYGNFTISAEQFQKVHNTFSFWKENVK